ncbi:MAG: endo-1,4-beta-xylanase [Actinomycetes bacterium]
MIRRLCVVPIAGLLLAGAVSWTASGTPSGAASSAGIEKTTCKPAHPSTCSLRDLADRLGLRIGTTIAASRLGDATYAGLLSGQFNSVTPENDLKWLLVQPTPGDWQFGAADTDLSFAEANHIEFWGHNLIYNQDENNAPWVRSLTNPDQLRQAVKTEIQTVVGRYRGRIHRWDVVNEPLATGGTKRQKSVFQRLLGPRWIDWCFRLAHEADPSAELWLNEYGTEWVPGKFQAMVKLVKGMQRRGVPIQGVGLELHGTSTSGPDVATLLAEMRTLSHMGLDIAYTEVDVPIPPRDQKALRLQAHAYGRIVSTCLQVSRCREITTWGLDDGHTWLDHRGWFPTPTRPLLFAKDLAPKPAFTAVQSCLARGVLASSQYKPACPGS